MATSTAHNRRTIRIHLIFWDVTRFARKIKSAIAARRYSAARKLIYPNPIIYGHTYRDYSIQAYNHQLHKMSAAMLQQTEAITSMLAEYTKRDKKIKALRKFNHRAPSRHKNIKQVNSGVSESL